MTRLRSFHIVGFKSIREAHLDLRSINILIGANGAGKSNLLSFFRFVRALVENRYQAYEEEQGGLDSLLYYGSERTTELRATLGLDLSGQEVPCEIRLNAPRAPDTVTQIRMDCASAKGVRLLRDPRVYRFRSTDRAAPIRQSSEVRDQAWLDVHGRNLPAFLYGMKQNHPAHYVQIRDTVRMVAPFFDDFVLEPSKSGRILLEWRDHGTGRYFNATHLSDGTLSFMCLAALLLQPSPPWLLLIDEPELGLHPYAIHVLAALLRSAAAHQQIIVSTQSVTLLDQFDEPEDVIVVERQDQQTAFRRLSGEALEAWRDEYSLGDLWQKNLLGGRP